MKPASGSDDTVDAGNVADESSDAIAGVDASEEASASSQSRQQGEALMDAAFAQLNAEQRSAFILRYFQRSAGVEAVTADMRGDLPADARNSLADILQQIATGLRAET